MITERIPVNNVKILKDNGLFLPVAKPKLFLGSMKAFSFRTLTPYSRPKAGSSAATDLTKAPQ